MVGRSLCPIIFSSFCLLLHTHFSVRLLCVPLQGGPVIAAQHAAVPGPHPFCASRPASPPATSRPGLPAL
eukprot:7160125-Heterocapsa_arctica.AAC.1